MKNLIKTFASTAILSSACLFALPQNAQVVSGDVTTQVLGASAIKVTTGHQAIINWQEFSIRSNEYVQFIQPSKSSATLNRVTGANASQILGRLRANGKIYLINPNGVIIGKDAVITAGDFLASTLDVTNSAFLAGQELLFQGTSENAIINYGTIETLGGNITLIGRLVDNQGRLKAQDGQVSMAAGQEVVMQFSGAPNISIRPSVNPDGSINQAGTIEALMVDLQAEGSASAYGINVEGHVLALNTVEEGGKIYLKADSVAVMPEGRLDGNNGGDIQVETGTFTNAGSLVTHGGDIAIHATGPYIETAKAKVSANGGNITIESEQSLFSSGNITSEGEVGGNITLLAPNITLVSADVNASGSRLGGNISVGANADVTHLSGNTRLSANNTNKGNAGTITVWANDRTLSYATFSAKGKDGRVEVSSGNALYSSALKGETGITHLGDHALGLDAMLGAFPQFQFVDPNAGGGSGFGDSVAVLTTGNVVITKPQDNAGGSTAGAVYLYNGSNAALISTLTGSTATDEVGKDGITTLTNGNCVITSSVWNNGAATEAGAATWINGTTGLTGSVSAANSLVGTTTSDHIGVDGVAALTNGNYVVASGEWNNGILSSFRGAATWGDGTTGITGAVSISNSLYGTVNGDSVARAGVTALTNGNYVVNSDSWDGGGLAAVGAVTWGNGTTGTTGAVSGANSIIGGTGLDQIGIFSLALTNGNYVIGSSQFEGSKGAATWADGTGPTSAVVSSANSLVGSTANDFIGTSIVALTNGNYVVNSQHWDNGAVVGAGSATWGDGTSGTSGVVSSSNSLVGTQTDDQVGLIITPLTNGNYVVRSYRWDNGATANAGAVTWVNGTTGLPVGNVTTTNSLYGGDSDFVGLGGAALTNGHYVIASASWSDGGTTNVGAVTWCDGTTGRTGLVTSANSLIGVQANDRVGQGGVTALTNGNYVVSSYFWDNGAAADAGAVTWVDGSAEIVGTVTTANSLVGTQTNDFVGGWGVTALTNGNYVVESADWNNGAIAGAGAVTWGDGTTGTTGVVSTSNSLVGSTAGDAVGRGDQFGDNGVLALSGGNYVVMSPVWDNGALVDAGAATFADGTKATGGVVSTDNSLVGLSGSANLQTPALEDSVNSTFIVSFLGEERVIAGNITSSSTPTSTAFVLSSNKRNRGLHGAITALVGPFNQWKYSWYNDEYYEMTLALPYLVELRPLFEIREETAE